MKRISKIDRDRLHLCCVAGCNRIWVNYFRNGRVCRIHDVPELPRPAAAVMVLTREPVPHWQDDREPA